MVIFYFGDDLQHDGACLMLGGICINKESGVKLLRIFKVAFQGFGKAYGIKAYDALPFIAVFRENGNNQDGIFSADIFTDRLSYTTGG